MRSALLFQSLRTIVAATIALTALITHTGGALAADDGTGRSDVGNLWDRMLETLDVKTTVGPPHDFVEATHPDPSTLKFIPTGAPHPKRPTPARSAPGIEAAKAALDAARDAQLAPPPAPKSKPSAKRRPAKPRQAAAGT